MRTFRTRQEMLKFNCICKVCKNGPAEDHLLRALSLDFQTICMKLVDWQKKAYNLGKRNNTSPSVLYRWLSAEFLYAALGFRNFKTLEFM